MLLKLVFVSSSISLLILRIKILCSLLVHHQRLPSVFVLKTTAEFSFPTTTTYIISDPAGRFLDTL